MPHAISEQPGPRELAIDAGDLIEVDAILSEGAGIRPIVDLTSAAWDACVGWTDVDSANSGQIQDETGRLWDVLWMARNAIRFHAGKMALGRPVEFAVHVVPRAPKPVPERDHEEDAAQPVTLVLQQGTAPGTWGPVITIRLAIEVQA